VMTVTAEVEGSLQIVVAEGTTVPVGTVIAIVAAERPMGANGDGAASLPAPTKSAARLIEPPAAAPPAAAPRIAIATPLPRPPRPLPPLPAAGRSRTASSWPSSGPQGRAAGSRAATCSRPPASLRPSRGNLHRRREQRRTSSG